ncbi:MAG: LysR family transcriptional regulator [Gammaproteobacteria bacterium]|jgi:DNA-binding transcriptional LysR family regulator|nr:LysR family transcriptional regulator [Gammaproteobacteria bacterium]MBU1354042.1 LysR family transcriptional regulator [Gammaproteobacteria bacterium]MBU1506447.1 LysR family transcriptional regulator [Gammaproteobacteria bacterium]MBU2119118.1 LysR family transcriptional regulator [Gammaproteobacteria bacterium]MBU2171892.1 LysR family transcriptional regulator [Gammaproteobacteria bacterium]
MNMLDSMEIYVLAVEKGSLSAAAAASGISATMAGNHLRMLEKRLGTQLLHRTTRRQHLTAFGEEYYARCREILRLVAETDALAQNQQLAPSGQLRITAPVTFGTEALMPVLSTYLDRYPDVSVDLVLNDRVVDLLEEGFEAAIRIGPLPDSALIARPLTPYRLMVCASPAYLARRGTPQKPADLTGHECVAFSPAALKEWSLTGEDGMCRVPVSGRLQVNNGQALRMAALHGLGIVLQPSFQLASEVRAGRLVQLFPDYALPSRPMSVVYPPNRYRSPKLRSFVDFLLEQFS